MTGGEGDLQDLQIPLLSRRDPKSRESVYAFVCSVTHVTELPRPPQLDLVACSFSALWLTADLDTGLL